MTAGWVPPRRGGQATTPPLKKIVRADAGRYAAMIDRVVETNPGCFEGEDLTVARSIAEKLRTLAGSAEAEVGLEDWEDRVLARAIECAGQLVRPVPPAPPSALPTIIPVAVGVGVGAFLLFTLLSGK